MQLLASRTSPFHRFTLALVLAATAAAAACSGGKEAPSNPAAAKTAATPAKTPASPAAPAPAAPAAAAQDAKPAAPALTPASPPAPKPAEEKPAVVASKVTDPAQVPAVRVPPSLATHNPNPPSNDPTAAAAALNPGADKDALAAKADLAKKSVGDPLAQEADPNSKAKLTYEFGSDSKNFGKCMQGDVLTHTFQMQSAGEEDLVIKQAKPTCGCTVAQVSTQAADGSMAPYNFGSPIPVGRKIEITATLHTQNKRGHAASRINIFSNDPRGQSQLGLEADVDPYFQVNPQNLNFNQLSARDTANDKVTITTTKSQPVKLTAALDNVPAGMKVELIPTSPDADGKSAHWELACHLGPNLVEGNLAYTVTLKSDVTIPGGEKLPNGAEPTYEVTVPIMARVTGMISYTPAFVSLGLIRPGQVVSRTVRVTSHDPEFKLTEPKILVQGREGGEWDLASHFSTVIRPVTGENSIDVELRLDGMPESLNGSFSGQLVIQVGHPEKPEIKLPITGVCRGGNTANAAGPAPSPNPSPNPSPTPAPTPPK